MKNIKKNFFSFLFILFVNKVFSQDNLHNFLEKLHSGNYVIDFYCDVLKSENRDTIHKYSDIYVDREFPDPDLKSKNVDSEQKIYFNPGFAPYSQSKGDESLQYYTKVTGFYNHDYAKEPNLQSSYGEYEHYYHEGVDFSGGEDCEIRSLIRAKVIAYGWQKNGNNYSTDMEGGVTFWIHDNKGRQVASLGADIEGDKAEAEWTYHWDGTPLKEKPKFKFKVTGNRCKQVESSEVEISQKIKITVLNEYSYILKNIKAILTNNKETIEKTSPDGVFEFDVIPSEWRLIINDIVDIFEYGQYKDEIKSENVILSDYDTIVQKGIYCYIPDIYLMIEFYKSISE